jgi:helicase
VIDFYVDSGIEELFPPQVDSIDAGLLNRKNILAAVPNSCGKTMIAELATLNHILNDGKVLYITPLVSLASEKYKYFKQFECLGVKVGIALRISEINNEYLSENDIVVCTCEKADAMIIDDAEWIADLTLVVADDLHFLGHVFKGSYFDISLTKLKSNQELQIVGLSEPIGNAEALANWLDAELIVSEWHPTLCNENMAIWEFMDFGSGYEVFRKMDEESIKNIKTKMVLDNVKKQMQCLVHEDKRQNCIELAIVFSNSNHPSFASMNMLLDTDTKKELDKIAMKIENSSKKQESKILAACIRNGAAYYHSGLNLTQRRIIKTGFENNYIKVIFCTDSIYNGFNLDQNNIRKKNSCFNLHNWPIQNEYGSSLTLVKRSNTIDIANKKYICKTPPHIESYLIEENMLTRHILDVINTGLANSSQKVIEFIFLTFLACTEESTYLKCDAEECLKYLKTNALISDNNGMLSVTPLGNVVSCMHIHPETAVTIIDDIDTANQRKMYLSDFSFLQLICKTKDVPAADIMDLRESYDNEDYAFCQLNKIIDYSDLDSNVYDKKIFLKSVKSARILLDWINEVDANIIRRRYYIRQKELEGLSDSAARVAKLIKRLVAIKVLDIFYYDLDVRLEYGVREELLPLLKLNAIGSKKARKLFNCGIKSIDMINTSSFELIAGYIGTKTTIKVFEQLGITVPLEMKTNSKDESVIHKQKSIFDF